MSPALPDGDVAPTDGTLGRWTGSADDVRQFGVYVHVPFCTVRCGYCDFNTYTATELGGGASQDSFATTALREIEMARGVLARTGLPARPVSTVFFGGGTPTILPASDLIRLLDGIRDAWGLVPGAEVTTEANPDSVDLAYLQTLADAGFTRVSFGMQSAVPHVLATLERTHDPARIPDVVAWAREAGLEVSLDLIYGTPGESLADWRTSLETALACDPDHISAYALVVEQGTKMAGQVRRGELALPSEDDQAAKYELADELLTAAGLAWYEVSNWARPARDLTPVQGVDSTHDGGSTSPRAAGSVGAVGAAGALGAPGAVCRHNLAYWRGQDWWGIGPGAHSYLGGPLAHDEESVAAADAPLTGVDREQIGGGAGPVATSGGERAEEGAPEPSSGEVSSGVRWWNVKHPRRYAAMLERGESPAAGRERLSAESAQLERIMLEIRLREGLDLAQLSPRGRTAIAGHVAAGLLEGVAAIQGRAKLTLRGRLLADTVIRDLTD